MDDRIALETGTLDLRRELLHRPDGSTVRLTAQEAAVVRYMAARAGEVVARDALLVDVWGYDPQVVTRAVDHTIRRLRKKVEPDPTEPMHLLTVHGEGYRWVGLAATTATVVPGDPGSSLHGRTRDLARLEAEWAAGARLVTLLGPGGVGKTRLATEWLQTHPGVFVDLAGCHDAEEVTAAVARAVGARLEGGRWRGPVGAKRVVLDNCEQALEAVADLARTLLDQTQWTLLATSRHPLGLAAEHPVPLVGLDTVDGVALLRDRARSVAAPEGECDRLGPLVERLDGLPLALELAAARLGVLGPDQLLERLGGALDLLRSDQEGRHGTLRATVAWSWALLEPEARSALARCTVFASPFEADDAERVLGLGDGGLLDLLETLRAHCLLQAEAAGGRRRLRLLDTIRWFAAEHRPADPELDRRHAVWAAALPADRRPEHTADLLQAHAWALPADPELALALASALEPGFRANGPASVWLRTMARTAGLEDLAPLDRARARLLGIRARHALGRPVDAEALDAIASAAQADRTLLAEVHQLRAHRLRHAGQPDAAEAAYREALAVGPPEALSGRLMGELGGLAADRQRLDEARDWYRRALDVFQALEQPDAAIRIELLLAQCLSEQGALDEARASSRRALEHHRQTGNTRGEGVAAGHLALIALEAEELEAAARWIETARACTRAVGDRRYEGYASLLSAMLRQERGAHEPMEQAARAAIEAFDEVGDRRFGALATARLGAALALQGEHEAAANRFAQARRTLQDMGFPGLLQGLDLLEGLADAARGDPTAAAARLARCRPLAHTSFARLAARALSRAL